MSDAEKVERQFEEFLDREARAYNAPPEIVPRDVMWTAIQSARSTDPATAGRGGTQPGAAALRRRRVLYSWVGMAATLVIGIAIGNVARGRHPVAGTLSLPTVANDTASTMYQVATSEHLARAEALLTVFGTSPNDAALDEQLASWARDVLSNTRLLLDSPAGRDPSRRRLLEDLERVLVEIVQRSPTAGAGEERSHIERSLERTQVLPRLRSAQLNGVNSGT
ncbi:MAG TPA: hypothetical protein VHE78_07200 [Gemmatimonadaceae bacterium]|nr:hypothetical protein [Gemmatimonadaceae bacterium]